MRQLRTRRSIMCRHLIERLEERRLLTGVLEIDATTHALSYHAQAGFSNQITVQVIPGTTPMLQVSDAAGDDIALGANATAAGWTTSLDAHTLTGPQSSVSSFLIDTNDSADQVFLVSANVPVTVSPTNGGSDTVVIGGQFGDMGHSEAVTGQVTIQNANGTTQVVVNNSGDSVARQVEVTDGGVGGLTPQPIIYDATANVVQVSTGNTASTVDFVNAAAIKTWILESSADDTVNIRATTAGSTLLVGGVSGGHPSVNITQNGSLQSIQGRITFDTNNEFPTTTIDGSADSTPMNVAINDNGQITGLAPATIDLQSQSTVKDLTIKAGSGGNTIAFQRVADSLDPPTVVNINSGSGNDIVKVPSNPSTNSLHVDTQAGTDQVQLGFLPGGGGGDARVVKGSVSIASTGGSVDVSMDASTNRTVLGVGLSDTALSGLSPATIALNHPHSLSVLGSMDLNSPIDHIGDNFTVTPSTTTAFNVDGGPSPQPGPFDTLTVATAGLTPTVAQTVTSTGLQGSFSFPNRQTIAFTRIGSLLGTVSGQAFSKLTGVPIPAAGLFLDQNGNMTLDAGEPTTTTDAAGNYSFRGIAPGSYLVIQQAIANQVASNTVPVTVTPGALVVAPSITDAPPALPNGPDLTGSLVLSPPLSVVGGAKGKLKLKISNSGTTSATGAPQIALFASTDGTLDPTDTAIGTVSAGNLKIANGGSKIVTLSFTYPKTLANGGYFVLAAVDSTNVIAESNEGNNVAASSGTIQIAAPVVDLAGKFGNLKSLKAGKPVSLPLTIQNLGNIPATGTITVDLFSSLDATPDGSDPVLASNIPVRINIKGGKSQTVSLRVPAGATHAGSAFLIAKINSTQSITESTLGNNDVVSSAVVPVV